MKIMFTICDYRGEDWRVYFSIIRSQQQVFDTIVLNYLQVRKGH